MSRIVIALLSFLFLVPQGLRATAQLTQAYMSKQSPDMNSCSATPATAFSTTDKAAYLVFAVSGVNVGDVIEADFYASGTGYGAIKWDPETQAGNYCYALELDIAGYTPATLPGTWTVYIVNNGSRIGQPVTFTIGGSTTTCSYLLSPTSALNVAAGGGSGSFTVSVTAGTGCSWTASPDVTWITGSISGSTVNYTVLANTSTSSRTGHITVSGAGSVGAQTFTVTQLGASGGGTTSGNLIVDGDAETATAVSGAGSATSIPGWTTDGIVAVVAYTDTAGDLSDWSHPSSFGNNYFSGGYSASAKMTQTINLSSYAAAIDAGTQPYTLDGWLGGWSSQDDQAKLTVTFLSTSGGTLGTASIGPVLAADRGNVDGLLERTTTGTVPSGTRSALITLEITRTSGSYNDGCADNLSFTLSGGGSTGTGATVYYRFENGAAGATATGSGSIVDSAGSQNGTPSGTVTYSSDVPLSTVGGAANKLSLSFAGTGSVQFPGAFPLNSLTNATMEFYIKPTGTTNSFSIMDVLRTGTYSTAYANGFSMAIYTSGNSRTVFMDYLDTNGTQQIIFRGGGVMQIPYTGWSHVAIVKSGNVWTGYINGIQMGQPVTATLSLPNNTGWTMNGNPSGVSEPTPGLLDEFRISNSALTPSQFLPPVGATPSCSYSLATSSASVGAGAGSGSFTVTTGAGCALSAAAADVTWITPAVSGTTVNYTVQANTGTSSRTGHITVNGQTFTVNQAGAGGGSTSTGNFTFGFGSTSGLTLVGNAAIVSTSDGTVLRLTPASKNQTGAAYSTTPVTLGNNATFNTQFQFRFSNAGGTKPADGITFVLGTSTNGLGASGVGLGYQGVSGNSVAIEFDTYDNTNPLLGYDDGSSSNHVAIDKNGSTAITATANVYGKATCDFSSANPNTAAGCMSNGHLWTVNINYDGSKLTVTLTDPAQGSSFTAINGYAINLASLLGQNTAYVGFTGGTGNGYENQDIVNWTFANTAQGASCTYTLPTSSASVGAGAGSGSFTVTTGTGCTLSSATADVTWITPTVSGTTVSYTVQANTSTSSRTGHITVNGQTFTVTQAGAASCSYTISPTSNTMTAQGGSSSITVTVAGGGSCSWSASVSSSASSWLHLGSTTSGTTSGSVSYSADANTSTVSRNGTIAFGSLTFTLTQAGGASATAPSVNQGGIVNAVSNRGGGGIAQGSMFTIYGTNLGPAASWTAYQFPIPDTVNNVTVNVKQGSTTLKAYLLYVQANQINAIMPSNTPLGDAQITVTYNGIIGASATVTIVKVAFGINSTAYGTGPGIIKNYDGSTNPPLNTASTPAKPGQVEIVVGTGLGPITTPDNQSPPAGAPTTPVQVLVGGIQADVAYSGRAPGNAGQDQVNFTVPANAPMGCSVPVQISAGGIWGNLVRMAISTDGKHCQDSFSPYANLSSAGGNAGTIGLIRVKFNGQSTKTGGPINAALDLGIGAFVKHSAGGDVAYSPFTNLPPPGACSSTSTKADQGTVTNNIFGIDPTIASTLDAGAQLTVTGGAGGASGKMDHSLGSTNPYAGLLGGALNVSSSMTVPPPFLDGGPFTVSGPGGKDVGPFSTSIALTPAITWTNPPSTINRASPLTLTWTGGDSTEVVVIGGSSTDQTSKAYGGFTCVAPAGAHSFTVPVNTLADLNPVGVATSSTGAFGMLLLMPLEPGSMQFTPLPKGLDVGVVFDTTATMQQVQVQ